MALPTPAGRPAPPPREESKAAREGVAHSRTGRKKARGSAGLWERVGSVRVSGWMIGVPVVVIGVVVVAALILTSGSSGGGGTGRGVGKIDNPGSYLFRCAFHPTIEFGTLELQ